MREKNKIRSSLLFILWFLFCSLKYTVISEDNIKRYPACKVVDHLSLPEELAIKALKEAQQYDFQTHPEVCEAIAFLRNEDKEDEYISFIPEVDFSGEYWIYKYKFCPQDLISLYKNCFQRKLLKENPQIHIEKRMKNALKVSSKFFQTINGVKLDMSINQVIEILGPPQYIEFHNLDTVIFKWNIFGSAFKKYFIPKDMICPYIDSIFQLKIVFFKEKVVLIKLNYVPI